MATNYIKDFWAALSPENEPPQVIALPVDAVTADSLPQARRFRRDLVFFLSLTAITNVATALLKWPFKKVNTAFAFLVAKTKESAQAQNPLQRWVATPLLAFSAFITGTISAPLSLMLTLLAPFAEGYTKLLEYIVFPSTKENPKPLQRRIAAGVGATLFLAMTPALAFAPYLSPIVAPVLTAIAHIAHIGLIPFVTSVPGLLLSAFSAIGHLSFDLSKKRVGVSPPLPVRSPTPPPALVEPGHGEMSPESTAAHVSRIIQIRANLLLPQSSAQPEPLYTSPNSSSPEEMRTPYAENNLPPFTRHTIYPHSQPVAPDQPEMPDSPISPISSTRSSSHSVESSAPEQKNVTAGAAATHSSPTLAADLNAPLNIHSDFTLNIDCADLDSSSSSGESVVFASALLNPSCPMNRRFLSIHHWHGKCLRHLNGEFVAEKSLVAQAKIHLLGTSEHPQGIDILIIRSPLSIRPGVGDFVLHSPTYIWWPTLSDLQNFLSFSNKTIKLNPEDCKKLNALSKITGHDCLFRLSPRQIHSYLPRTEGETLAAAPSNLKPEALALQMAKRIVNWLKKNPQALTRLAHQTEASAHSVEAK